MQWLNTEIALVLAILGLMATIAVSCDTTPPDQEVVNVYGEE